MKCLFAAVFLASPWVESADYPREQQEKAYAATLRLKTETGDVGTAVRVARLNGGVTYYLTAAHVVKDQKSVDLEWFDPKTSEVAGTVKGVGVIETWPDQDLALLRANELKNAEVIQVCPHAKVPEKAPFPALSLGCPIGSPDLWLDQAKAKVLVRRPDEKSNAYFWRVGRESVGGRSGGPLVDKNGYLIGICSGIHKESTYYVHIDEIHKCLKKAAVEAIIPK